MPDPKKASLEGKVVIDTPNPDEEIVKETSEESQVINNGKIAPNKDNPTIKVDAARVHKCKGHIKGMTYKVSDDDDKSGTFIFQTREQVWGTIQNTEDGTTEFAEACRSFPASDWGVIPTLRADMVFSNIIDVMIKSVATSEEDFANEFGHKFDDIELSLVQLYVPAGTGFINPWTTLAKPVEKFYDKDYVFTYITGFKYDPKNINHKQLLKEVYDGMPCVDTDKDSETFGKEIPRSNPMRICPEDFVDSLVDAGYLGKPDEKTIDRMYKSIGYKR